MRLRCTFILALVFFGLAGNLRAQDDRLIAMLRVSYDGELDRVGAAVIVAQSKESTTLVTAAHTVTEAGFAGEKQITAEFLSLTGKEFEVSVERIHPDPQLDLAVLRIYHGNHDWQSMEFREARTALYPATIRALEDDSVYAIGFPGERAWFGNRRPDAIKSLSRDSAREFILYSSSVTSPGMSGGGLFSEHGTLLGMVLNVGVSGARALSVRTIRSALASMNIPFELTQNDDALTSIANATLRARGTRNNAAIGQILQSPQPDLNALQLFWIAGYESDRLESLLRSRTGSGADTFAEVLMDRLADNNECTAAQTENLNPRMEAVIAVSLERASRREPVDSCKALLGVWFRQTLSSGLNPNLVINLDEQRAEALLAIALHKKSTPAALALLDAGASPNPFVDLNGLWSQRPLFTHPLDYLLEHFSGKQLDQLWHAFDRAGVVVLEEVRDAGDRLIAGVPPAENSSVPLNCDSVTAHTKYEWCAVFGDLPRNISVYVGTGSGDSNGRSGVQMTHLLFANEQSIFLAGVHTDWREQVEPVVVAFSRVDNELRSFIFGGQYGCRERKDGSSPNYCWRGSTARAATAFVRRSARKNVETPKKSVVAAINTTGVNLSMTRSEATTILEESGFELKAVGNPDDYPDQILTLPYVKEDPESSTYLTMISVNDTLLGLRANLREKRIQATRRRKLNQPASRPWLPELRQARDRLLHFSELPREFNQDSQTYSSQVSVAEKSGSENYYFRDSYSYGDWAYRMTTIFRRSLDETVSERAFWDAKVNEWFQGRLEATEDRPCIDDARWVRHSQEECLSRPGFSAQVLDVYRDGEQVSELPSGILYEYLERGDGARLAAGHKIRYLGDKLSAGALDSDFHESSFNGDFNFDISYWLPFQELLPQLRVGDRLRLMIPPEAWDVPLPRNRMPTVPVTIEVRFFRMEKL